MQLYNSLLSVINRWVQQAKNVKKYYWSFPVTGNNQWIRA